MVTVAPSAGGPRDLRDRARAHAVRLPGQLRHLFRRHWAFLLLLLAGTVLRLLVVVGYDPALWYQGDSQSYLALAYLGEPSTVRPYGYSLFLSMLVDLHSVRAIIVIQHLTGLAMVVAAYVFLRRRGVSRLVGALAATPLLLDARTVAVEHYLLAETLFTALLVLGMLALTWRRTPGWPAVLIAGVAFSWAATTRSIGLAALAVPVLYLLLRRVDWRRAGVFVAVVAVSLGGYLVWYHSFHGQYSFGSGGSRFLWSRTMTFVDCDQLDLTDEERLLCPDQPLGQRLPPDLYLWGPGSKKEFAAMPDAVFGTFARKAILGQPGDFLGMAALETWRTVRPGPYPNERVACVASVWDFPAPDDPTSCSQYIAPDDPAKRRYAGPAREHEHPLMNPLHGYSEVATVPATLVALCFLLVLLLGCHRPRASSLREWLDPLALVVLSFGMIVASVATSAIDPRYTVPSLPLGLIGAALAWRRFRAVRHVAAPATGSTPPLPDRSPSELPDSSPSELPDSSSPQPLGPSSSVGSRGDGSVTPTG
ncbi:phospholipid carrier-dependent glycosyltransferase [Micromonospora sp. NPDC050397]|uniref:phospholipid carrier-dependent glycosyltransferase n=1 Tax=Micromonospora sp. NPDC050397 TaxID=3364279 RepID=UPI00384C85E2